MNCEKAGETSFKINFRQISSFSETYPETKIVNEQTKPFYYHKIMKWQLEKSLIKPCFKQMEDVSHKNKFKYFVC